MGNVGSATCHPAPPFGRLAWLSELRLRANNSNLLRRGRMSGTSSPAESISFPLQSSTGRGNYCLTLRSSAIKLRIMRIFFIYLLLMLVATKLALADYIGTGFFYNNRGDILTNRHVVDDCEKIEIILPNRTKIYGSLISVSSKYDLAAIKTKYNTDRFAALRVSQKFPLIPVDNEEIFSFGFSYFERENFRGWGVMGHVISLPSANRDFSFPLRIDVTPGSSGSPVIGRDMLLVGVITAGQEFGDLPDEMGGYYGDNLIYALNGNAITSFINEHNLYMNIWEPTKRFMPFTIFDHLQKITSLIICKK